MSAKITAAKQAVAILKAAGAEFHIRLGDKEFGEPLAVPKRSCPRRYSFTNTGVYDFIRQGKSGDYKAFMVADMDEANALRGVILTTARSVHGTGSVITAVEPKGDRLEVSVLIVNPKLAGPITKKAMARSPVTQPAEVVSA